MNNQTSSTVKTTLFFAVISLMLCSLSGCPSSSQSPESNPKQSSQEPLPKTMVASTVDSGLTATVGMPKGDISDPDGNPITVSTVPAPANTSNQSDGYNRVEQGNATISYSGKWITDVSSDKYSGDSAAYSSSAGAQIRYTFNGTAIRWIGYRDTSSGIADVYLDGKLVTTVDTFSSVPREKVVEYAAKGLSAGSHTLAIQVEGRHNREAMGSSVWIDAFDIQPSTTSAPEQTNSTLSYTGNTESNGYTRIQQDDSVVGYTGNWTTHGSSLLVNYSGGTAAESSDRNAQVNLSFTGTAVRWIGYRDTFSGIADVYLDGSHVATVDAYSILPQSQVILYSASGLTPGSHSLTIKPEGKHRLLALGSAVWVDAFDIQQIPPDTTPPTVAMTTPADGATVSNTITVSANASDNVGVAGVQFELDGAALGAEDTAAPYTISWDSITIADGTHTLTAVASDAAGNHATASPVTITVSNNTQPPPDTTPPTVAMTAPADGATVSNTITVSADASDNVGVAGVQFELDGAALGAKDTAAPYAISWDSTTIANGTHTLTAVASDAAGNHATASPVTITVSNNTQPPPDTTPPTVAMTAPADGATVSNTITVSADASDNVGVAGVQFELDGAALGTEDATEPYAISWDTSTVANGTHTLTAVARDAAGNQTTATPVTVTVSNSSGGGGGTTRIEQDDPAVTYTGTWVTASDSSVSGGTAIESNQANATATLTFNGTGVSWISYRCTCTAGISNVSVDGGTPTQVDTYSAQAQPQVVVYSVNNLPKGTHTLSIEITGTYDPDGETAYVVVDAFDVTN